MTPPLQRPDVTDQPLSETSQAHRPSVMAFNRYSLFPARPALFLFITIIFILLPLLLLLFYLTYLLSYGVFVCSYDGTLDPALNPYMVKSAHPHVLPTWLLGAQNTLGHEDPELKKLVVRFLQSVFSRSLFLSFLLYFLLLLLSFLSLFLCLCASPHLITSPFTHRIC